MAQEKVLSVDELLRQVEDAEKNELPYESVQLISGDLGTIVNSQIILERGSRIQGRTDGQVFVGQFESGDPSSDTGLIAMMIEIGDEKKIKIVESPRSQGGLGNSPLKSYARVHVSDTAVIHMVTKGDALRTGAINKLAGTANNETEPSIFIEVDGSTPLPGCQTLEERLLTDKKLANLAIPGSINSHLQKALGLKEQTAPQVPDVNALTRSLNQGV